MKRIFAGLMAAVLSLSLLAGCGQEGVPHPLRKKTSRRASRLVMKKG